MADLPNNRQKYLYCVIGSRQERCFDVEGVGDGGAEVHTVVLQDLAMVVSDAADQRYDHTRANLLAHERVIERVMGEGFTVLPVRFGTVTKVASKRPVEDIQQRVLRPKSLELHTLLAEMDDKVELDLKALWRDEKAIFEELLAETPGLRQQRDSLRGRPAAATHYQRAELGRRIKAALDRKREQEGKELRAAVRPLACRSRENPNVLDRMVLNDAFLVQRCREEEFDQVVAQLDRELGHRLLLKYSGPHPPFNFVELRVTWDEEAA